MAKDLNENSGRVRLDGRTGSRYAAVQVLFQLQRDDALKTEGALKQFAKHRIGELIDGVLLAHMDQQFFAETVRAVQAQASEFDDMLMGVLPESWTVERLDPVIRNILRVGCYELADRHDVPARASIDELMSVSALYYEGKELGFINGVLNGAAEHLRPDEVNAAES